MNFFHVIGARPNFMKAAPVYIACRQRGLSQIIVHTGQHYDYEMSGVFFEQLGLPPPDLNLQVGSASHAQQTAQVDDAAGTDSTPRASGLGDRLWRCEFDACGGARLRENCPTARACGSRAACVRSHDARRSQSHAHGPGLRFAFYAIGRRKREFGTRGYPRGAHSFRRQCHDRHADQNVCRSRAS